jgi:hypothetical protein
MGGASFKPRPLREGGYNWVLTFAKHADFLWVLLHEFRRTDFSRQADSLWAVFEVWLVWYAAGRIAIFGYGFGEHAEDSSCHSGCRA